MSIQSTREILREHAISRLVEVRDYAYEKNYRAIESISGESSEDIVRFVKDMRSSLEEGEDMNVGFYTNTMLASKMDEPFFRHSEFENYCVSDKERES